MQNYKEISLDEGLSDSLAMILDNDKTALSCSSGTAFPTANVQIGQLCFRTDENKLYQTKDGTTWVEVSDLSKSFSQHKDDLKAEVVIKKELINAQFALLRGDGLPRYSSESNGSVGTIAIKLPLYKTTTMVALKIAGYDYRNETGRWEANFGGYTYSSGWLCTAINSPSNLPWGNSVRFGDDGTYAYILLGDLTTKWYYPKIWIEEVALSYSGVSGNALDPSKYDIALITDETGFNIQATKIANTGVVAREVEDGVYLSTAQTVTGAKTFSGVTRVSNDTQSTGYNAGALIVTGGVGVNKNLNVGGEMTVAGKVVHSGIVIHNGGLTATTGEFNSTVDATSSTTGALKTSGGLGVAKSAFIGGDLGVTANATIGGNATITGKVSVGSIDSAGAVKIADSTASSSATTGALIVTGGIGTSGKVYATGGFTGNLTGNAASATKLYSARAINGVNFDGSASITVPVSVGSVAASSDLNTYQTPGFYSCPATATAATLTNCPTGVAFSLLVEKHAGVRQTITEYTTSGFKIYVRNMYSNAWGAWIRLYTTIDEPTSVSGNAGSATKLATARTIALTGAVTGTATSFDGSANISIATTAIDGSKITTGTIPAARIPTLNQSTTGASGLLTNLGRATALAETTEVPPKGLTLVEAYNNGYPASYGNVLRLGGTGQGEIFVGWPGSDTGSAPSYIRGKRDNTSTAQWSPWREIVFVDALSGYNVGSANTATKLATARKINGVNFDGTANITIADSTKIAKGEFGLGLVEGGTPLTLTATTINDAASWYSGVIRYSDATLPGTYGHGIRIGGGTTGSNGGWFNDMLFSTGGLVSSRYKTNGTSWSDWITHITSENIGSQTVAAAAKLSTARTIQGVSFDGTANITLPIFSTSGAGLVPARVGSTATKYLREDGTWVTPTNTTYSAMAQSEANTGTATTGRLITAAVLKAAIQTHAPTPVNISGSSVTVSATDNRIVKPSNLSGGTASLFFTSVGGLNSTNDNSTYGDLLALNSYKDTTGGNVNSLMFLKGSKKIYHYQAAYGATTWGTASELAYTTDNVASATKLETARLIGGVAFDGTANINLPGVNTTGNQNTTGNAATATQLATARTIGGVAFNGTANINLPGVNTVGNQNTTGSAATLTTARTINGTSFNGSANITTANWGTARTITIGSTGKSVNGSANISWTLAEIGAAAEGHTHSYLPLTGGTLSGDLSVTGAITATGNVTAYSDKRVKKNVKQIENALAKVLTLKGVTFDRKDMVAKQTGLIAQDVEAVLPEAVSHLAPSKEAKKFIKDGEILAVSYGSLAGLFVEAFKDLNDQLQEQAKLIDKQAKLIENLLAKSKS